MAVMPIAAAAAATAADEGAPGHSRGAEEGQQALLSHTIQMLLQPPLLLLPSSRMEHPQCELQIQVDEGIEHTQLLGQLHQATDKCKMLRMSGK